ncbi:DNA cytosine methyltransferase [Polycladidibacter hongkongensis]|uniref:DNA cytosine methyltransferase n=1 Tax=Polycladidibacter hongkongensis TaxID=1647556 RepID=UPI000829B8E0|nr:DNA cytosine methyltransferase [Pseudovibrio hongkongensis]
MRFLSVCSGIEAASVAWEPLGWEAAAFAEIEPFPSAVLAHHYPNVSNLGDMTKFKEWPDFGPVDLICGVTPCQAFSVAGLRRGLADPRGNLALTFLAIVDRYRPRWVLWENVPGVLSSNGGRDFGALLGALGQLGYGWSYRVLDAQYCRVDGYPRAVPQRRRRVFLVGYLGDWRRAAAVLSEPQSVLGNTPPCRQAGKKTAPTLSARTQGGGGLVQTFDRQSSSEYGEEPIASTMSARDYKSPSDLVAHTLLAKPNSSLAADLETYVSHTLKGEGFDASEDGTGHAAVAYDLRGREGGAQFEGPHQTANIRAASGGSSRSYVAHPMAVRRLTPTECERLMGLPDGYTQIPYRGKLAELCPDGPRYKALGNSWAVNAARWVGMRIQLVEDIQAELNRRAA